MIFFLLRLEHEHPARGRLGICGGSVRAAAFQAENCVVHTFIARSYILIYIEHVPVGRQPYFG